MKGKKLITLIAIVILVVAVISVLASVFSVKSVLIITHDITGKQVDDYDETTPTGSYVLNFAEGKGIIFLSKDKLLGEINSDITSWHAFCVVKNFPNQLEVHVVRRTPVAKFNAGPSTVYVDCFGYVCNAPEQDNCVDITSAFEHVNLVTTNEVGKTFEFAEQTNNERLSYVLVTLRALWRCYVEYEDMDVVLGRSNVFTFNSNGDLVIKTTSGAIINILDPDTDLENRVIKVFSVYYTEKTDLQKQGIVIKVLKNGRITTN